VKIEAKVAVATSIAWGLVVSIGAYAIVRALQRFLLRDPNPATLVWSAHAGFFWRAWTVAYAGGIASFVAFVAGRGRTESAARALAPAVLVAAALIALQSLFLP
jgi:choline-glycine betaine transporter